MTIGIGIIFIAIGTMLSLLIPDATDVLNLGLIGWICMGIGIVITLIGIVITVKNHTASTPESRSNR